MPYRSIQGIYNMSSSDGKINESWEDKEQLPERSNVKKLRNLFESLERNKKTDQIRKEKRWSITDTIRYSKREEEKKQDDWFLKNKSQSMKDITRFGEIQEEKKQSGYSAIHYRLKEPVPQARNPAEEVNLKQLLEERISRELRNIIVPSLTREISRELNTKFDEFQKKMEQCIDEVNPRVLNAKIEELQKELDNRKTQFKSVWKNAPLYPDWRKEEFKILNVTLDETTAHPNLLLSDERTQVTWKEEKCQDISYSTERFDFLPCVLGQTTIIKGRVYWEVEVGHTGSWDLGVCRDDVSRKGRVNVSPRSGFWCIRLYDGEYWALSDSETQVTLKEKPHHVGIFLDIEDGDLSFYNMKDNSHIFSFSKLSFSGILRPYFRLRSCESGPITLVHIKEN